MPLNNPPGLAGESNAAGGRGQATVFFVFVARACSSAFCHAFSSIEYCATRSGGHSLNACCQRSSMLNPAVVDSRDISLIQASISVPPHELLMIPTGTPSFRCNSLHMTNLAPETNRRPRWNRSEDATRISALWRPGGGLKWMTS